MRKVSDQMLRELQSITRLQLNRVYEEFDSLLLPFGKEERSAWRQWISQNRFGAGHDELIAIIEDASLKLSIRSRALLLLLSPVWMNDIRWLPWKWRGDVFVDGETRVLWGSEDYRGSKSASLLSSDDEALATLALSFMQGFQDQPLSLVEGTLLSHNVFRRHLLVIFPKESLIASKAFDGYWWLDTELSRERRSLHHILTPFEVFLTEGGIDESWKLKADERVWEEVLRERRIVMREYLLWERYLDVVEKGLSVRMKLDGELPGDAYPLFVFKQQLENVWKISPEEFRKRESNASRFLDVFGEDECLRPFGRRIFMEMIDSREEAFALFSGVQSLCFLWEGMVRAVLGDVVKKLGESQVEYARRLVKWFELWEREQQRVSRSQAATQEKESVRKESLRKAMRK